MTVKVKHAWGIALGMYVAALVGLVVLVDQGRMWDPLKDLVWKTPYGDKVAHFLLVGLLSGLAVRASRGHRWLLGLPTAALAVFVLATGEELSQRWFPPRTVDLYDFLANTSGIVFFGWLGLRGTSGSSGPEEAGLGAGPDEAAARADR